MSPAEQNAAEASAAIPLSEPAEYDVRTASRARRRSDLHAHGRSGSVSHGVPYPMWLALLRAYPEKFGATPQQLAAKFGFVAREPNPNSPISTSARALPLGMHLTIDPLTGIAFVVNNCALCHAERLRWRGGEALVIGLGNKRVQIHAYDAAFADAARDPSFTADHLGDIADAEAAAHGTPWPTDYRDTFIGATVDALRVRAGQRGEFLARTHDGPPGRVATIETFALAIGQLLGHTIETAPDIGWAKIPDVIGFAHRSTLSWDGVGTGPMDVLAVEADFAAGVRVEWFLRHPLQGASLGAYLRHPTARPKFPGAIDAARAERGRAIFDERVLELSRPLRARRPRRSITRSRSCRSTISRPIRRARTR